MSALHAVPVDLREAAAFVAAFHRHNGEPVGGKFAVGVSDGAELCGVAIVSRPVGRMLDDGQTLEVIRCCVRDAAPRGACSFLYGRCWQAAKAMGYRRLVTYTLQSEPGCSLRGAGWRVVAELGARKPAQWQNRPGREWHAVVGQAKLRWEAA
jgi:hypothetical protein